MARRRTQRTTQNLNGQRGRRKRFMVPYHVYDEYGYWILSDLDTARAFLVYFLRREGYLELAEKLKTAKLELKPTRHAKSGLRSGHSDVWIEATIDDEEPWKLRIQVEIKGSNEARAPLQVGIYCLEDAGQELRSGTAKAGSLTERISLIFNLGRWRWRGRRSVGGMFDGRKRKCLKNLPIRGGQIPVADVMAIELDELMAIPHRRLALCLSLVRCANDQKRHGETDLVRVLRRVNLNDRDEVENVVLLLRRLHAEDDDGMLCRDLKKVGIGGEAMKSIEQAAENRGGAEAFLRFARRKFKRIPKYRVEQVRSATPEQIDDWLFQASSASSLASVFNGSAADGQDPARKKPNGSP